MTLQEALKDDTRIYYYRAHLLAMLSAITEGANMKGYFAWSLLDNFEWGNGYTVRFRINFVDYNDGYKRYPKTSAHWLRSSLRNENEYDALGQMDGASPHRVVELRSYP